MSAASLERRARSLYRGGMLGTLTELGARSIVGLATLAQRDAPDVLETSVAETDWQSLGLVLAGLGAFLIGLAVLARGERGLVEAHLGSSSGAQSRANPVGERAFRDESERGAQPDARWSSAESSSRVEADATRAPRADSARASRFVALREALFLRAQLVVGFTWLALGFACQLVGRFHPSRDPAFPVAWTGAIVVATGVLLALAWAWSLRAARELVREELRQRGIDLCDEPALARELGELFGVESRSEDTVETYTARLASAIGLAPARRRERLHPSLFDMDEGDEAS